MNETKEEKKIGFQKSLEKHEWSYESLESIRSK